VDAWRSIRDDDAQVAIRSFDRSDAGGLCGSSADTPTAYANCGGGCSNGDARAGGTADANARGNRNVYGAADGRTQRHRNDRADGDA